MSAVAADRVEPGPSRDREVAHLVLDRGLDLEEVGKRFGLGASRVQQIMARETRRDQIVSFLAVHRDDRVSSGEIAHSIKVDAAKVDYVVRGLVRTGRALATSAKTPTANGVRETWDEVRLSKRGLDEFARASRPKRTIASSLRSIMDVSKKEAPTESKPAPAVRAGEFPAIARLLSRGQRLQEAAAIIDNAGEQYADLALTVLGKIDEFTDLEREVVEYVRTHPDEEKK